MIEAFFSIVAHAISSLWRFAAAESDKADPFCDLDRTRQSSSARVGEELDRKLLDHLRQDRRRRAINALHHATKWDQARAETYLQTFQVGRPTKVET